MHLRPKGHQHVVKVEQIVQIESTCKLCGSIELLLSIDGVIRWAELVKLALRNDGECGGVHLRCGGGLPVLGSLQLPRADFTHVVGELEGLGSKIVGCFVDGASCANGRCCVDIRYGENTESGAGRGSTIYGIKCHIPYISVYKLSTIIHGMISDVSRLGSDLARESLSRTNSTSATRQGQFSWTGNTAVMRGSD